MPGRPVPDGVFAPPAGTYLDTASYGIPPLATIRAMDEALRDWSSGRAKWFEDWDPVAEDCRALIASLIGAQTSAVAVIPAVSVGVSMVATGFESSEEVLLAADEFNSVNLPLEAAAKERGVRLRKVAYPDLAAQISPQTALVALSHVRSNGGGTLDLEQLVAAAKANGAAVLLDVTHSAGVRAIDTDRLGIDFVVGANYKHLLSPRGTGFLSVSEPWLDRLVPRSASWRGQVDPYTGHYGGSLGILAESAARFDVSLDWLSWVGARPALELLASIPTAQREAYCVGLATACAEGLGVDPTGSSVVGVPYAGDRAEVRAHLDERGVRVTVGEDVLRVSFHLYNDTNHVDRAVDVLTPLVDLTRVDPRR